MNRPGHDDTDISRDLCGVDWWAMDSTDTGDCVNNNGGLGFFDRAVRRAEQRVFLRQSPTRYNGVGIRPVEKVPRFSARGGGNRYSRMTGRVMSVRNLPRAPETMTT